MFIDHLALIAAAAFAGIALYVSLVEHPARLGLDDRAALAEWQPSYKGAAAMQAPLALAGGVFGFLCFVLSTGWLWLLGAAVLVANVPYTLIVIKPVNDQLLAMEPGNPGANARGLLEQWGKLHWNRTLLGLAATALFFLAII